jgi:hypothetical protein
MLVELFTGKSPFADECENEYSLFYSRVTGGSAPGSRSAGGEGAILANPALPVLEDTVLSNMQAAFGDSDHDEFGVRRLLDMCFTRDPVRRASADVVASAAEACAVAAAQVYLSHE